MEFTRWMAYDMLDPGEPFRGDMRAALLATTFAGAFSKKGNKPRFNNYLLFEIMRKRQEDCSDADIKTKMKNWLVLYRAYQDSKGQKQ